MGGGRLKAELIARLKAGDPDVVRSFHETHRALRELAETVLVPVDWRRVRANVEHYLQRRADAVQLPRRRAPRNARAPRRSAARAAVGVRGPPSSDDGDDGPDDPPHAAVFLTAVHPYQRAAA